MQKRNKKWLIVITGASGSGKSTLAQFLKKEFNAEPVITHTTREPRHYEKKGVDYYFETEESFFDNHLLEQVHYGNYFYGSSREGLQKAWDKSDFASIVVDTKGAQTYMEEFPDNTIGIYLEVGSIEELKTRLLNRGDSLEKIDQRINSIEFNRDLAIPDGLKNKILIIKNDNFDNLTEKVKKYIKTRINS